MFFVILFDCSAWRIITDYDVDVVEIAGVFKDLRQLRGFETIAVDDKRIIFGCKSVDFFLRKFVFLLDIKLYDFFLKLFL